MSTNSQKPSLNEWQSSQAAEGKKLNKKNIIASIVIGAVVLFILSALNDVRDRAPKHSEGGSTSAPAKASTVAQKNDYSAGDTVKFDDSSWCLVSSQDLGQTLSAEFVESKSTSGKFIKVKFCVTNTTNEEEQITETPKLIDSSGRKYSEIADGDLYLKNGAKTMGLEQLPAGIEKTFYGIYEVPASATGLKFQVRSLGFAPDYKVISL